MASNLLVLLCFWNIHLFNYFFFTPETYRDDAKFDLQLPTANHSTLTLNNDDENSFISASTIIDPQSEKDEKMMQEKSSEPAEQEKKKSFSPFAAFALLRHPFVLLPSITGGFFFGAMFATGAILPEAFEVIYGLTSWQTGLCYLGAVSIHLEIFSDIHLTDYPSILGHW
jgi:hypothetical protein